MEQYISKSALVAEMEKRKKIVEKRLYINNSYSEEGNTAWERDKALYDAYNSLLSSIDTLEVKEVDLDKEIEEYLSIYWSNEKDLHPFLGHVAKHFFELALSLK